MKKLVLLVIGCGAFLLGYGAVAHAYYPSPAPYGRAEYHGYFTDVQDFFGTDVLPRNYSGNAFPASVNSASSFTSFVLNQLTGNAQQRTGGAFIIQTMLGSSRNKPPTAAQQSAWVNLVNQYQATGRVSWSTNFCYTVNSFYQGTDSGPNPADDAFVSVWSEFGHTIQSDCATAIVFVSPSGQTYGIRRQCANPVGNGDIAPLPIPTSWTMSGATTVDNTSPKPNTSINFSHTVTNNGPTATGQDIWFDILNQAGTSLQGGQDSGPYNAGQTKPVRTYNVPIPPGTAPGTQYCQRVLYDWANSSGGRNGLGNLACATVAPDYDLAPDISLSQGGLPLTSGSYIEPGTNVSFTFSVANNGYGNATGVACNMYANNHSGFFAIPSPAESSGPAPVGPVCTNTYAFRATTSLGVETINNVPADTTICRSIYVNPASPGGGAASKEACVYVANEPYARVYGGDVSAGNGQPSNCALTNNAAIVGWNKELAGGYGGAGVQYAALALHNIYDMATNLGNAAGTVTTPSGLAFANTTASGSSIFGGKLGSMSTSCIPDYYGTPNGSPPGNSTDVGTLASGVYVITGPLTIVNSSLGGNKNVSIYVNGDAIIKGSITYSGNWSVDKIPLFHLAVTGNIYIDAGVDNVDGFFVAQSPTAGIIYTCASGTTPVLTTSAGYYNTCKNRLEVNGSFVARQVQLLRTNGTLNTSSAADSNTSTNTAEVFNYGPAFWIPQPVGTPTSNDYDSVTSLPPIL